jgi:hypothetical protein
MFTLGTSRAGTGVLAALANLRLFGREGLRAALGHLAEMAHQHIHQEALAGRGVMLSLTDCYRHTAYGEPVVGLKSFILYT